MPESLELEIAIAAHKVVDDLVGVKPGESVLITLDSRGYWKVAEETAKAAAVAGAKVLLAWHSTPNGYGKIADPYLPDGLKSAIPNTDVWIEYNHQWLLYSTPWEEAVKEAKRVRYLFLGGLNADQFVRLIGCVDLSLQKQFQDLVVKVTKDARTMRITTPAGTDIIFENDPERPVGNEGWALEPGAHFLLGQIDWAPIEESINGTIVFDGSISGGGEAEIGILREPITFLIKSGKVIKIDGGREAKIISDWLERLSDPGMYNVAHVCYGFNPQAKLSGLCTEDERVWGATEWGFGYQNPFWKGKAGCAISHMDGICLNSSVWLDDELIMEEGKLVHPGLADLARKIGKQ
jgi:leucyl aminopeptidase (aminopeptidase T)